MSIALLQSEINMGKRWPPTSTCRFHRVNLDTWAKTHWDMVSFTLQDTHNHTILPRLWVHITYTVALFQGLPTIQFLQHAKREMVWSILSCEWCQCRQRGVSDWKNTFCTCSSFWSRRQYVFHFVSVQNSCAWGRNYMQARSFNGGLLPLSTYEGTNIIHMIKWTRPSPSVFVYCKWSRTGQWEGLGTRLSQHSEWAPIYT